jgi:alkanesulfonate monooxygenase SsuD/methylene tetrahydromethanopterin reductase-like flavin-dependent oxidoreductase (luciferase family)
MIGIVVHLADSRQQALKEITPLYEEHAKMFAPLGFLPGVTKEQIAAIARRGGWYESGVPRVEHYIDLGGWFAGTPEEFVAFLKNLESRFPGMEHVSLSTPMGTPEAVMLEQYRRIASEVMPHFKN